MKLPADGNGGALLVRDEIVFNGRAATPPSAATELVKSYLRTEPLRPRVRLRTLRRGVLLHVAQARLPADVVDDTVAIVDGPLAGSNFRELEVQTTEDTPEGLLDSILKRLRRAGADATDPTPKYLRAIGGIDVATPEIEHRALPKRASAGRARMAPQPVRPGTRPRRSSRAAGAPRGGPARGERRRGSPSPRSLIAALWVALRATRRGNGYGRASPSISW